MAAGKPASFAAVRSLGSVIALLILAAAPAAADSAADRAAIEALMTGPVPEVVRGLRDFELLNIALVEFYEARDYSSAWLVDGGGLTPAGEVMVSVFTRAREQGLRPGDYLAGSLDPPSRILLLASASSDQRARTDITLTAATVHFIKDLHEGRFSPRQLELGLDISHRRLDLALELEELVAASDPERFLARFEPRLPMYVRLKRQLARYRRLEARGDWRPLSEVGTLREGDAYGDIDRLRERLRLTVDLAADAESSGEIIDPNLTAAVVRFQERHGLAANGVIGAETFAQLNRSWRDRLVQIVASLERTRWIPDRLGGTPIVVNVPEFHLRGFTPSDDSYALNFESTVIVGKSYQRFRTPIFSGDMVYLDFRPYWNVPPSLVRRELSPHLDEEGYLAKHDYEIVAEFGFDARPLPATPENLGKVRRGQLNLRQRPGPRNALGLVKFIFPNEHNVYLHSTPAQQLFARTRRDFSHGCIRVEDPVGLAEWVLEDQAQWDRSGVERAMNEGGPKRVRLTHEVPVYILYVTAVVKPSDGRLYFFDDIYGLDADLAEALGETRATVLERMRP